MKKELNGTYHKRYDKLLEFLNTLKDNNELNIIKVYYGNINGIYNYIEGKKNSSFCDIFKTDGEFTVVKNIKSLTDINYKIEDANFMIISTILKNNNNLNDSHYVEVNLLFDENFLWDFICFVNKNDYDYLNLATFCGSIDNYKESNFIKEWSIIPSKDLIENSNVYMSMKPKYRIRN